MSGKEWDREPRNIGHLITRARRRGDRIRENTREGSVMSTRFRLAIFGITCLGFIGLCAPISSAQVARTELHAIPTLTLSDHQFLIGDKNGTPVTIAGVLRVPRLGTDRSEERRV